MYTMRSSPCFEHSSLNKFDEQLRECLSLITNIQLSDDQWKQASLPIRMGGLGIRLVSEVAPSAFLSSVCATKALQDSILICSEDLSDVSHCRALSFWSHLKKLSHSCRRSLLHTAELGCSCGERKLQADP